MTAKHRGDPQEAGRSRPVRKNSSGKQPNPPISRTGSSRPRAIWRRVLPVLGALILVGAVVFAIRSGAPGRQQRLASVRPGQASGYNVLLVTLDTVRRDRLGCYGAKDARTPTLDSLAAHGVRVEDAVTCVPITLPSHATILTGLYPPHHGLRDNGRDILAPEQTTLAETLRAKGYACAAFVGCFVLDARFGLSQGFDPYNFDVAPEGVRPGMVDFNERPADKVTDAAISWFRARSPQDQPFFTWVHYFDAHLPYQSPLQSRPEFSSKPYEAEISFVDSQLGRLLAELRRSGRLDRTIVAVVSDHGEGLGEHGEPTHAMLLYSATTRVPLLLSCPSLFRKGSVLDGTVVTTADIRPTIEDLLGLAVTQPCDGQSLLREGLGPERTVYLETMAPYFLAGWSPLRGIQDLASKHVKGPEPRSFDLVHDPGETRNIVRSPGTAALEKKLDALLEREPDGIETRRSMSDEEMERLASLGYISGGPHSGAASLADPETMMPVYRDALRAERLYSERKYNEAADLAAEVLRHPGAPSQAVRVLAFSRIRQGRGAEGVKILQDSVQGRRDTFLVRSLAQALVVEGRFDEALDTVKLYASIDPTDGRASMLRGDCFAGQGHYREALDQYKIAGSLDPDRVGTQAVEKSQALREKYRI